MVYSFTKWWHALMSIFERLSSQFIILPKLRNSREILLIYSLKYCMHIIKHVSNNPKKLNFVFPSSKTQINRSPTCLHTLYDFYYFLKLESQNK